MNNFKNAAWCKSLLHQLELFQRDDAHCDVVIKGNNGVNLSGHSSLLSVASPVLQAKLERNPSVPVYMNTISSTTWKYVLDFIYSGKVNIPYGDRDDVQNAAKLLQIKGLTNGLQETQEKRKTGVKQKKAEARKARKMHEQLDLNRLETIDNIVNYDDDDLASFVDIQEPGGRTGGKGEKKKKRAAFHLEEGPPLRLLQYNKRDIAGIRDHFEQLREERMLERQQEKEKEEQERVARKEEQELAKLVKKEEEAQTKQEREQWKLQIKQREEEKQRRIEEKKRAAEKKREEEEKDQKWRLQSMLGLDEQECEERMVRKYSTRGKRYKYTNESIMPVDGKGQVDEETGEGNDMDIKNDSIVDEDVKDGEQDKGIGKDAERTGNVGQEDTDKDVDMDTAVDGDGEDYLTEDSIMEATVTDNEDSSQGIDRKATATGARKKKGFHKTRDDVKYPSDIGSLSMINHAIKCELADILSPVLEPYVITKEFTVEDFDISDQTRGERNKHSRRKKRGVVECEPEPCTVKDQTMYRCGTCKTEALFVSREHARSHLLKGYTRKAYMRNALTSVEKVSSNYLKNWEELYRCKICFKLLRSVNECVVHLRSDEKGIVKKCLYTQHRQTGDIFRCDLCNKLFFDMRKYEIHLQMAKYCYSTVPKEQRPDNRVLFKCQRCGMSFVTQDAADRHANKLVPCKSPNAPVENFRCDVCGLEFNSLKRFAKHKNSKIQCASNTAQEEGEFIEKQHNCRLCNFTAEKSSYLVHHARARHYDHVDEALGPYAKGYYECQICHAVLPNKQASGVASSNVLPYYAHLWVKHKKKCSKTNSYFQCEHCDFRTCFSFDWDRHLAEHPETAKEKYMCDTCGKRFLFYTALKTHYRKVHSDVRYECEYCAKEFKTPPHLESHLPIHTGKWPYQCTLCQERFITGAGANHHISGVHGIPESMASSKRTYTRYNCNKVTSVYLQDKQRKEVQRGRVEKPRRNLGYSTTNPTIRVKCRYCGKVVNKGTMEFHLARHTGKNPFQCKVCPKTFLYRVDALRHLRNDHGVEVSEYRANMEHVRHECNQVKDDEVVEIIQPVSREAAKNKRSVVVLHEGESPRDIPFNEAQDDPMNQAEAEAAVVSLTNEEMDSKVSIASLTNEQLASLEGEVASAVMEDAQYATSDGAMEQTTHKTVPAVLTAITEPRTALAQLDEYGAVVINSKSVDDTVSSANLIGQVPNETYIQIIQGTDQDEEMDVEYANYPSVDASSIQVQYVDQDGNPVQYVVEGAGDGFQYVIQEGSDEVMHV